MRVLVQRVHWARVRVGPEVVGAIDRGVLLLTGIGRFDGEPELAWMARKIVGLRIFPDAEERMNRSILELGGGALVVSQFTLYGDCRKGLRPSFTAAAPPEQAAPLVRRFAALLAEAGIAQVATGRFGAGMDVELSNEGPVTLWLEREGSALEVHGPEVAP